MKCSSCIIRKSEAVLMSKGISFLKKFVYYKPRIRLIFLKYCDKGFMYFPHSSFSPFLRVVDDIVKGVVY